MDFLANLFDEDPPPVTECEQHSEQLESIQWQCDIEGEIPLAQSIQECNEEQEHIQLATPKSKLKWECQLSPQAQRNLHHIHLLEESEQQINLLCLKLNHLHLMIPPPDKMNSPEEVHTLGNVD